jgi:predicted GIY-YIG superfamily endonuclease
MTTDVSNTSATFSHVGDLSLPKLSLPNPYKNKHMHVPTTTGTTVKRTVKSVKNLETRHSCYIITNERNDTYNGYTVNFSRRIRQHNGDIKGGAFYTKNKGGPWSYLLKVESPHLTRNGALSLEWSIKYPTNRRPRPRKYSTPLGRLQSLPFVFGNRKFAEVPVFNVSVAHEYLDALMRICGGLRNVRIRSLHEEGGWEDDIITHAHEVECPTHAGLFDDGPFPADIRDDVVKSDVSIKCRDPELREDQGVALEV